MRHDMLLYLEPEGGGLSPVSQALIATAFSLTANRDAAVFGFLPAAPTAEQRRLLCRWPWKTIYFCPDARRFHTDLCGAYLTDCIRATRPDIVLAGATAEGKAAAAQAAARLGTGLTADCTELLLSDSGRLIQRRPTFGGNRMAEILTERTPQIATVQPPAVDAAADAEYPLPLCLLEVPAHTSSITVLGYEAAPPGDTLSAASRIVAIGRGVRESADIPRFRELADRLGAVLGCSRALVERGWMPARLQIGLSGCAVRPDWLLTLGVSGSIQFQAGIRGARQIFAVDLNPDAPILRAADHPFCCDLYEVTEALLSSLS